LVDYGSITALTGNSINSNRSQWQGNDGSQFIVIYYNETRWVIAVTVGEDATEYFAALGTEFRPEQANWSASGSPFTPTTSSTFGLVRAGTNEPRFDHSTTAPNACLGLLIEESRTNLLLNSNSLSTQTRTVTAGSHTLSFHGTGTIVLSGAAIATVTGTGAYPTRTTLTFTTTAGSLTLTRTGSVTQAQLELGGFATSYIPTTTASVVRSADLCSITGAAFTGMYNASEGSVFVKGSSAGIGSGTFGTAAAFCDVAFDSNSRISVFLAINTIRPEILSDGVSQYIPTAKAYTANTVVSLSLGIRSGETSSAFLNNIAYTGGTNLLLTVPSNSSFSIGKSSANNNICNGHIQNIRYYKKRLANTKLQALTV
jgi:hypothetical protein